MARSWAARRLLFVHEFPRSQIHGRSRRLCVSSLRPKCAEPSKVCTRCVSTGRADVAFAARACRARTFHPRCSLLARLRWLSLDPPSLSSPARQKLLASFLICRLPPPPSSNQRVPATFLRHPSPSRLSPSFLFHSCVGHPPILGNLAVSVLRLDQVSSTPYPPFLDLRDGQHMHVHVCVCYVCTNDPPTRLLCTCNLGVNPHTHP